MSDPQSVTPSESLFFLGPEPEVRRSFPRVSYLSVRPTSGPSCMPTKGRT